MTLGNAMSPSKPLNGCEINVAFALPDIQKQLYAKTCFSSLDVSEMFVLGVS